VIVNSNFITGTAGVLACYVDQDLYLKLEVVLTKLAGEDACDPSNEVVVYNHTATKAKAQ